MRRSLAMVLALSACAPGNSSRKPTATEPAMAESALPITNSTRPPSPKVKASGGEPMKRSSRSASSTCLP